MLGTQQFPFQEEIVLDHLASLVPLDQKTREINTALVELAVH